MPQEYTCPVSLTARLWQLPADTLTTLTVCSASMGHLQLLENCLQRLEGHLQRLEGHLQRLEGNLQRLEGEEVEEQRAPRRTFADVCRVTAAPPMSMMENVNPLARFLIHSYDCAIDKVAQQQLEIRDATDLTLQYTLSGEKYSPEWLIERLRDAQLA